MNGWACWWPASGATARSDALIYVLVMARLVFALVEGRVRNALAARCEHLIASSNRAVEKPTTKSLLVLEMLASWTPKPLTF